MKRLHNVTNVMQNGKAMTHGVLNSYNLSLLGVEAFTVRIPKAQYCKKCYIYLIVRSFPIYTSEEATPVGIPSNLIGYKLHFSGRAESSIPKSVFCAEHRPHPSLPVNSQQHVHVDWKMKTDFAVNVSALGLSIFRKYV